MFITLGLFLKKQMVYNVGMICLNPLRSSDSVPSTNPCLNKYLSLTLMVVGILTVVGGLIARYYYGLNVAAWSLWGSGGAAFLTGAILGVERGHFVTSQTPVTRKIEPTNNKETSKVVPSSPHVIHAFSLSHGSLQRIDDNQHFVHYQKPEKLQAMNKEFLQFVRENSKKKSKDPEEKLKEALTKRGLDPDILLPNEVKDPLVLWTYRNNFSALTTLLLSKIKNLNAKNLFGETLLSMAMLKNDETMIFDLLEKGCDPNTTIPEKVTYLNLSVRVESSMSRPVVDQIKQSKNIEFPIAGTSLLQWSIDKELVLITEQALSLNADPNCKNKKGETPVSAAMKKENEDLVLRLVRDHKGDVNTQMPDDEMSLFQWAVERELSVLVGQLYIGKANPNLPNHNKETAVTAAMQKNDPSLVLQLLERRGDPNTVLPECGTSLLQWAIEKGHRSVWEKAIALKADPTIKNRKNQTALRVATELGNTELLAQLMRVDGTSETTSQNGKRLLQWANKKS